MATHESQLQKVVEELRQLSQSLRDVQCAESTHATNSEIYAAVFGIQGKGGLVNDLDELKKAMAAMHLWQSKVVGAAMVLGGLAGYILPKLLR